jgi:1-acyl-sn-glycerol-3-phosphate acyltransferase
MMFPTFVVGAGCFYIVLRVRLQFAKPTEHPRLARLFIHLGARLLFFILRAVGLVRLGLERTGEGPPDRQAYVLVANHPSMLDAMLLLSVAPNAICVMKRSLLRVPIIGGFARRAEYIPFAAPPELLDAALRALREGTSLIIFPEGTRSPLGSVGEFKRGAARIAIEAGVPIELFTLSMEPVVLGSGSVFLRPPRDTVRYQAVRIMMDREQMNRIEAKISAEPRERSIQVTRWLEDHVENSILSRTNAIISGVL